MGNKEKAADVKAVLFKRLYGVKPDTFEKMRGILQKAYEVLHKQGGKPPKLTVQDKLRITLKYLREYRTMESIGAGYEAGKSAACESLQWVEDAMTKDKTFRLPDKKALKKNISAIEYIAADVTESPINSPKKPERLVFR